MNISEIINSRKEAKKEIEVDSRIARDLNRPLIMALFGIDVYGGEATDDTIIELIIGKNEVSPAKASLIQAAEDLWDRCQLTGNVVKGKDGKMYHNGRLLLRPISR